MLVIGSPEVRLVSAAVSDQDLIKIAGKVLSAYTEFVVSGGEAVIVALCAVPIPLSTVNP